ncbi:TIGR03667 family PPOX class F420-dependent oxidoreductase [Rhodococcus chondri]|uniref:TIGR03667 family PPOX class F420-dependent oxidoreductase n=1 Tax=Rhodococcus chondri TaxID=3065941 RepID=A0ABU7JQ98_9NOCA|nr:TIGR03667 family PPOX class F420-dependent oxidoreductase [Rhodococcus sp. CC-R104]MEE2032195.1 TIGR03667 family PPOX class F420-dependent oxidoreductase [Rhodococcus sp. CC-R104]
MSMTETVLSVPNPVLDRLERERVLWLTTVDRRGTPVPTPVWFLWSQGTFLMFSQPGTPKLTNMAAQPRVSVNLNADAHGGEVAVFTAEAHVEAAISDEEWRHFVDKYAADIGTLGLTPETFRADYSVPVRMTPRRFRGW